MELRVPVCNLILFENVAEHWVIETKSVSFIRIKYCTLSMELNF